MCTEGEATPISSDVEAIGAAKPKKRTRGAQPGNTLALKHGAWSASRGLARRAWVRQVIADTDELIRLAMRNEEDLMRELLAQMVARETWRA